MGYSEQAETLLREWVESEQLRKHCYAVAASLRHFAARNGGDPDLWHAVGLLHDMDFERYPQMPPPGDAPAIAAQTLIERIPDAPPMEMHPFVGVTHLRQNGWSVEVCRAILSHADYTGVSRDTPLEKTLAAVDELSSFVIAVAMVRPTKSVHEVEVAAVRKKMKDKAFARAVSREDILHGAESLGVALDDLIAEVIAALRADAKRLGVDGVAAR
jgi:predicted hydrolase (HD superfamily)